MHILEISALEQEEEAITGPYSEAVFRTVPKDSTAFLVWKVTEAGTELLPRTYYGTFYDADCYLVYSASLAGQPAGPDVIRREIRATGAGACPAERHVHAWAGEHAGALAAAALRRAGQLHAHLGGRAVLHRETQAKESPRLQSYFRDGIRIIRSGSTGGSSARLYRVRGRRPSLQQLSSVGWAQLCSDGVFVLDTPALVFLWLGRAANLVEKIFGAKIAYRMARGAEKGMNARRIAIAHDGYEQTLPAGDRALLDALLELRARAVRSAELRTEARAPAARLYRAHAHRTPAPAARATCRLEEVKRAPLSRDDLADDGVYVVDAGARGIWAWVGASAATGAPAALAHARAFARKRRAGEAVSCTPAGREPVEFCALFVGWKYGDARRDGRLRVARSATTRLDAQSLAGAAWLAAQAQLLDDGSGAARAWRVRARRGPAGERLQEIPHPQAGVFYDEDCYVVLYAYHAPTGDQSVIYNWMGGSSPNDLRNLGAKEAKDLYTKLGRLPVQVRVYQGKEPAHFLQIFKGRMITYAGSATESDPLGRRVVPPARSLVRVSGQYAREARGTEVREGRAGGGSGACYVLREGARVWVWCATCATGDEREVAKQMAASDHVLVMQGKEKEDFWTALDDKKHLLVSTPLKEVEKPLPARLFYVSLGIPGQYTFEEIISFNQYDLLPEMAAILDTHSDIYVWLGEHTCPHVKDNSLTLADTYLQADPAARDPLTPILVLNQGREPPSFTGFFPHWKPTLWKGHKTFNAIVNALEGKSIIHSSDRTLQNGNTDNTFDSHEKYPLAVLRGPIDKIPHNVDPLSKELYLTHDDFVSTFGTTYSDFKNLPNWKQKDLKKAAGLF